MSFLDNLENNLKSLESQEEGKADTARQRRARDNQRAEALASADYAEALKKGPFTQQLLVHATRLGHQMRTKVYCSWLGTTLRLEARGRRMELRPTAAGVVAVFLENNEEIRKDPVNLNSNPEPFLRAWLAAIVEEDAKNAVQSLPAEAL
ncbi:MAG TPA: hypothetical protein VN736_07480 [Candidatus Limnocylindrales bacterium]|nr:hypothetical protein [Candidatus Limnocylindrales bacterium]